MTDQEQFQQRVAADRTDYALRLVYADWLDEHDMPEAAAQQRMAAASLQWLAAYAKRGFNSVESLMQLLDEFHSHGDREVSLPSSDELWRAWECITGNVRPEPAADTDDYWSCPDC